MESLSQIETLVCVAEQGSLAGAARILEISPAAVSKQITKLEEQLGVQLLIRTTRKLTFTEIGKTYLEQAQRIMEEVDAARSLVSNMKAVPHGKLKAFSTPHFASQYITPRIPEFLSLYPGIQLQLEIGERIPHFSSEAIDVMLGTSMQANPECIHRRILTTRYAICASPEYLSQHGTPLHPEELSTHHCLTHSMRKPDNQFFLKHNQEVTFKPMIRINDAKTLIDLAVKGLGVVQLHHYAVKQLIRENILEEVLSDYTRKEVPIYVILPPRRFTPNKVRVFVDFICSFL